MTSEETKAALIDAILPHVAFDGWSDAAFAVAVADAGVDRTVARAICPRGALDLAVAHHRAGDVAMARGAQVAALEELRYSERVARLIRMRLEAITDKEAVRRGMTLFALPQHAAEGAGLIWGTADAIWEALGDSSEDVNWYTKRATLSGVYGATVLFWLGDDSVETQATWDFIDRRIEDVMRIEGIKSSLRKNALTAPAMRAHEWLGGFIKRPPKMPKMDLPGSFSSGT